MTFSDDVRSEIRSIFLTNWKVRQGRGVPEPADIALGNDAVSLDATVLYADLVGSTDLVNERQPQFAAEVYKAYLASSCRIIREQGGEITSFDGDRVMAIYIGDSKNSNAVKTALKINHCVQNIINPELKDVYKSDAFVVKQVVGIDTSPIFVARTGIRANNDLVWVGRAANYAAKLCNLRENRQATWITADVYDRLSDECKYGGAERRSMWVSKFWTERQVSVYSSSWTWYL